MSYIFIMKVPYSDNGQWTTMDNNGQQWATVGNNGQQWASMGNNGQQSAVLHASVMPFLSISFRPWPVNYLTQCTEMDTCSIWNQQNTNHKEHTQMIKQPCKNIYWTRSLGPLRARLLAGGTSGLLDFLLRALRPCDPRPHPSQAINFF